LPALTSLRKHFTEPWMSDAKQIFNRPLMLGDESADAVLPPVFGRWHRSSFSCTSSDRSTAVRTGRQIFPNGPGCHAARWRVSTASYQDAEEPVSQLIKRRATSRPRPPRSWRCATTRCPRPRSPRAGSQVLRRPAAGPHSPVGPAQLDRTHRDHAVMVAIPVGGSIARLPPRRHRRRSG
jgi:hypothetical protein